jgi:hypothetical protein
MDVFSRGPDGPVLRPVPTEGLSPTSLPTPDAAVSIPQFGPATETMKAPQNLAARPALEHHITMQSAEL